MLYLSMDGTTNEIIVIINNYKILTFLKLETYCKFIINPVQFHKDINIRVLNLL